MFITKTIGYLEANPLVDGIIVLVLAVGVGIGVGYWLNKPPPPKPETYKPEVKQADGSLILERTPIDAKTITPPPMTLPSGTHESRRIGIDIRPTAAPSVPVGAPPGTAPTCPKVHVDVSLAKEKDGSMRAVVKSPDGEVVGGQDIPIDWVTQPREWRYAAGAIYNPLDKNYGVFLHRDFSRLRVGAEVFQQRRITGGNSVSGQVIVGIRW